MIRNRSTRVFATLGVTLSLALGAMVGPAMVFGAQAQADFTATPVLNPVSPSSATSDSYVAYDISFNLKPEETSNLAQLFMKATTPTGWDLAVVQNESRSGTCDASGADLACTFGAVSPGDDAITLRVVYKVGTTTGNVNIDFLASTTGVSNDKKKRSHGDDYIAAASVLVENNDHLAASYVLTAGAVIADLQTLSKRNPQSTKVTAPAAGIVVSVGEEGDISACFGAGIASCFGEASVLSVGDGADYTSVGGFPVEIRYNVNKPNANFIHFFDDGVTYELITEACNSTTAPTNLPCKIVTTSQGSTTAILWLTENGRAIGW
jgi:hypothetical protein